jgi:hypothetical protein
MSASITLHSRRRTPMLVSPNLLIYLAQERRPQILELPAGTRPTHFIREHSLEYSPHQLREE